MRKKLLGKVIKDKGGRRGTGPVPAEADDKLELVCELYDVAGVNASELAKDESMDPVRVYG